MTQRPLRRLLATEAASSTLLLAATVLALAWASSPWPEGYDRLWELHLGLDLHRWVNDALMSVFFLVVGLEIKRELVVGELRDRRQAALPAVAALGGMVVPALLYLACNPSGASARGWGIPMATDIAFALGVLALVARSAPPTVRLFVLALAIVDDLGAIVVIAVFYADDVHPGWLLAAGGVLGVMAAVRGRTRRPDLALLGLGTVLWLLLHASGVHPTLAGVAVGLLLPVSRIEPLERRLQPWSSVVVLPLFALANTGVRVDATALQDALGSSVTLGIGLGLVLGKAVGIAGAAWLATRLGVADLPSRMTWRHLVGAAALGGIGFTVSLFVTGLAFDDPALVDEARLGILAASVVASGLGAVVLRSARTR